MAEKPLLHIRDEERGNMLINIQDILQIRMYIEDEKEELKTNKLQKRTVIQITCQRHDRTNTYIEIYHHSKEGVPDGSKRYEELCLLLADKTSTMEESIKIAKRQIEIFKTKISR